MEMARLAALDTTVPPATSPHRPQRFTFVQTLIHVYWVQPLFKTCEEPTSVFLPSEHSQEHWQTPPRLRVSHRVRQVFSNTALLVVDLSEDGSQ